MTAESFAQTNCRFEVHIGPCRQSAKGCYIECFHRHVRIKTIVMEGNRSQTNAIDRDTFAQLVVTP